MASKADGNPVLTAETPLRTADMAKLLAIGATAEEIKALLGGEITIDDIVASHIKGAK